MFNEESIKSSSAYLLFYRRKEAALKEYKQRPQEVEEPTSFGPMRSNGRGMTLHDRDDDDYGGYSMWSKSPGPSPTSWVMNSKDSDYDQWGKPGPHPDTLVNDGYGWARRGSTDTSPARRPNQSDDDSDAEGLPVYSVANRPYSGRTSPLGYLSDKRHGDDGDLQQNADILKYLETDGGHSTCASDGSNPGTANASPRGQSPILAPSTSDDEDTHLSNVSREGGRIDDIDTEEMTDAAANETKTGAGIPTLGSTASGLTSDSTTVEGDTEGDESEQGGVEFVEVDENRLKD